MTFHPTPGGGKGDSSAKTGDDFPVAPSVDSAFNTLRPPLIPIACWMMDDFRFGFNASVIQPHTAREITTLRALIGSHVEGGKNPLISLFGHADTTGSDDYNKILSGRRVRSVYGLLARKVDVWEALYSNQQGTSDRWGDPAIQQMLGALGFPAAKEDGSLDPEGVKAYQKSKNVGQSGRNDSSLRQLVFTDYMKLLVGGDWKIEKTDFLGKGADAQGKGDYQGCSDFNPVLMFSKADHDRFQSDSDKTERNAKNTPNRRVVAYLFRADTVINTAKWPCPSAQEGSGTCRKRFWSDAAQRRTFQEKEREHRTTQDTFACRFYERIAAELPCEDNPAAMQLSLVFQKFPGVGGTDAQRGIAGVPFKVLVGGVVMYESQTEADGTATIRFPTTVTTATLEIFGMQYVVTGRDKPEDLAAKDFATTVDGNADADLIAVKRRLHFLGYDAGDIDNAMNKKMDTAILDFQGNNNFDTRGILDSASRDKLKEQAGG